jgi:Flp pilus assembly protein TadD
MRRIVAILGLVLAGCATTLDEQAHQHNKDGISLYQRGQYGPAAESFQAALALRPEDPELHFNIGECWARQGANDKAQKSYNECLLRSPNHVACRFALAQLLVHTGRTADAVRMANDWLAREPKRADPYALDGWLWHQTGDLPRAQARLQQALELDPHNVRALGELGLIYEAMQRPDRARAIYERLLDIDSNQPEVTQRYNAILAKGVGRPKPE